MHESALVELERLFLALSDKTRMQLLALMAGGEVTVGYLADSLNQSQPKISRHLAYLRNMGIVSTRRDGKWIYYGIAAEIADGTAHVLRETLRAVQGDELPFQPTKTRAVRIETAEPISFEDEPLVEEDMEEAQPEDDWTPAEIDIFLL
jgi:DNA-binding transcriptional ArsR family regulator